MKDKKSNKKQGKHADGMSLSSSNRIKDPETLGRGLGSSFAMAVGHLKDQADSLKGSKNGFQGVQSIILDPLEYAQSHLTTQGGPSTKAEFEKK